MRKMLYIGALMALGACEKPEIQTHSGTFMKCPDSKQIVLSLENCGNDYSNTNNN